MLRLSSPVVRGLVFGGGWLAVGAPGWASAGEHHPHADNGLGNDGAVEDPLDGDQGLGNDGWAPNEGGGPCAEGDWGDIGPPVDGWLHVSALSGNDASADGTVDHPFATVATAVGVAATLPAGSDRVVVLWPGEYDAAVSLLPGEGWDDPVAFLGCSPLESVLLAADPFAPVLDLAVAQVVAVRGVGFVGGTAALTARDGVHLTTERVGVAGSREVGIAAIGSETEVETRHTFIDVPAADGCGWGIGSWGAETVLRETAVSGARGVAVFAEGGSIEIEGGSLVATTPDLNSRYGRAIHAQYADVTIGWTTISDSTDAAIFLLDPLDAVIKGVIIDITGAGVVGGESTGDAIVIVGGGGGKYKVKDSWIYDSARSSLVIEAAGVELSGNTFVGAGIEPVLGYGAFGQGGGAVHGLDAADVLWLAPGSELELDRDPMACALY